MRRCDQHISGVSTRYPAACSALARPVVIAFGEPVLPCIKTMPIVSAADRGAPMQSATSITRPVTSRDIGCVSREANLRIIDLTDRENEPGCAPMSPPNVHL